MINEPMRPKDLSEQEAEAIVFLVNTGKPWERYVAALDRLRQAERDTCEDPPQSMSERILGQHQGRSLQLKDVLDTPKIAQDMLNER